MYKPSQDPMSETIQIKPFETSMTKLKVDKGGRYQGIDIVFENISYSVQVLDEQQKSALPCKKAFKERQILKNISGIFKAGSVTAIMGASGAGKTTLLNVLSCRIQLNQGGKLFANNLQYNYSSFGDFANYVMQHDVLMQTLTVRQTLQFAAKLKINLPPEQKHAKVIQIANQMKLEKCLDTIVGGVIIKGISGGQRKRTSIAFELISDPQVLFLDEPTSGLDSLTSYIIVSELRKLTRKFNKTVIMTIHQPNSEIYGLFDNLVLLLEGRLIYNDKAAGALNYFSKHFKLQCPQLVNPSDFIMAKIHHQDQKNVLLYPQYFSVYEKNEHPKILKLIEQKSTSEFYLRQGQVSFWEGLGSLLYRNFLNLVRNPMLMRSKVFQGIFLALFIGGLFFGMGNHDYLSQKYWMSITGFLFFMTISGTMSALSPVTLTFPVEREVFFKEQDSKMYNVSTYFLARNIIEIPELIIIPLLTVSVYYFMIALAKTPEQFFIHCLIFILMSFNGSSLGLLIGSVILDAKSVSAVVPIVLLPIFLFSGFFKNRHDLPVWIGWIEYISPMKYGFNAFVLNEVQYKPSLSHQLNFDLGMWEAIAILFCLGVFFPIAFIVFLMVPQNKKSVKSYL